MCPLYRVLSEVKPSSFTFPCSVLRVLECPGSWIYDGSMPYQGLLQLDLQQMNCHQGQRVISRLAMHGDAWRCMAMRYLLDIPPGCFRLPASRTVTPICPLRRIARLKRPRMAEEDSINCGCCFGNILNLSLNHNQILHNQE